MTTAIVQMNRLMLRSFSIELLGVGFRLDPKPVCICHESIDFFGACAVVIASDLVLGIDQGEGVAMENSAGCRIALNGREKIAVSGQVIDCFFFSCQHFPNGRVPSQLLTIFLQLLGGIMLGVYRMTQEEDVILHSTVNQLGL